MKSSLKPVLTFGSSLDRSGPLCVSDIESSCARSAPRPTPSRAFFGSQGKNCLSPWNLTVSLPRSCVCGKPAPLCEPLCLVCDGMRLDQVSVDCLMSCDSASKPFSSRLLGSHKTILKLVIKVRQDTDSFSSKKLTNPPTHLGNLLEKAMALQTSQSLNPDSLHLSG